MPVRLKSALSDFFARLTPEHSVYLKQSLRDRLAKNALVVVDVGAAMGVDRRWTALGPKSCRFVTFEPDKRSQDGGGEGNLVFGTALANENGRRTLFLTKGPFASSLMRHNDSLLRRYGTWEWHEPVGEAEVAVDRLDACLASLPDWQPDFIKTDVEGLDLDVLKGGENALRTALGVQVEVAFVERHLGAPFFGDIDSFLRGQGFTLFQLVREHWLRRNGLFGPASRPQLIWGDAIYLRDLAAFQDMVEGQAGQEARDALLLKFVALLLAYGCHDYALEVVDDSANRGLAKDPLYDELRSAILSSARGPSFFAARGLLGTGLALIIYLLTMPFGARARGAAGNLVARQAEPLLHYLYRMCARRGLGRSCIHDVS